MNKPKQAKKMPKPKGSSAPNNKPAPKYETTNFLGSLPHIKGRHPMKVTRKKK